MLQAASDCRQGRDFGRRTRVGRGNPAGGEAGPHCDRGAGSHDDKLVPSSQNYTPGGLSPTVCKHFNIQNLRSASWGSMLELQTLEATPQTDKIRSAFHWMPISDYEDLSCGVLGVRSHRNQPSQARGHPRPGLGF